MALSLTEVLATGQAPQLFTAGRLAAALAAVFIASLTAYKGMELFRRRGLIDMAETTPNLAEIEMKEKIEKYCFMVDELRRDRERLAKECDKLKADQTAQPLIPLPLKRQSAAKKEVGRKPARVSRKNDKKK